MRYTPGRERAADRARRTRHGESLEAPRGGRAEARPLPGSRTGTRRLPVVPERTGGFTAVTSDSLKTYRVSGRHALGPGQKLRTAGYEFDAVAAGHGGVVAVAWTGLGPGGRTGPVEAAAGVAE